MVYNGVINSTSTVPPISTNHIQSPTEGWNICLSLRSHFDLFLFPRTLLILDRCDLLGLGKATYWVQNYPSFAIQQQVPGQGFQAYVLAFSADNVEKICGTLIFAGPAALPVFCSFLSFGSHNYRTSCL